MRKPPQKAYPPRIGCAFLTPRPDARGYICGVLAELLCVTRGGCKFFKPREDKDGR